MKGEENMKIGFTMAEGATHVAMQHNNRKLAFTLAEGATHVAMQHNNRKLAFTLAEGATHVAMQYNNRKLAFTLAEGATHVAMRHNNRKLAFTLAEVLITLAVIGIVAVMTIPNLVQNYQSKAWNTADTVFSRKLTEALKIMNTQGTLAGYNSTESFIKELSKHLKITKTCTNSNLTACFDDKISMRKNVVEVDINKVKTSADLGQSDWGTNVVGFQLASGVTGLMAYNPKCTQDQYSNQITGGDCLAVLYDVSGYAKPNFVSKDIRSNGNVTRVADKEFCFWEFDDGVCIGTPFQAITPLSSEECQTHKDEWQIKYCRPKDDDYWGGAVKVCGGISKLPSPEQLAQLATQIYGTNIETYVDFDSLTIKDQSLHGSLLGMSNTVSSNVVYVWTNYDSTYIRSYGLTHTEGKYGGNRNGNNKVAFCIVND